MKTAKRQIVGMAAIVAVLLLLAGCGGEDGETALANQPPSANAGPDQTVDMGSVVMLVGSGTDPDGEIASYQWAQTGGPTVSLSVTDDDGEAVTDDVTVTVQAPGPFMLGTSKLDDPNFRLQ